jgi:hypothetical protein
MDCNFITTARTYERGMMKLIRHIQRQANLTTEEGRRWAISNVDLQTDRLNRVFFTCNDIDFTIRLWNIDVIDEHRGMKRGIRINYSLFMDYNCNDCDKEYTMDYLNGWTRCEECANHYP